MSDDLNTRVAEAQGWRRVTDPNHALYDAWVDEHGAEQATVYDYIPLTNLNQAVAFAEWAMREKFTDIWLEIVKDVEVDIKWQVSFYYDGASLFCSENHENLAEALCRATLKALGKEEG